MERRIFAHLRKVWKILEIAPGVLYIRELTVCGEKISFIFQVILVAFLQVYFNIFAFIQLYFSWCMNPLHLVYIEENKASTNPTFQKNTMWRSLLLLQRIELEFT